MTIPDPSSHPLTWLHRSSGRYVILHHGINEADMKPVVVYQRVSDGSVWVRPSEKFFDGRFAPDLSPLGLTAEEEIILEKALNMYSVNER